MLSAYNTKCLYHLLFTTLIQGKDCYNPHFIKKERDVKEYLTDQGHPVGNPKKKKTHL